MSEQQKQIQTTNGQSKAIVTGPQARLNTVKGLLEKSKGSIAAILPKHLTPERLIKLATSAASRNTDLLDCTPESLLLAVVQAGTLGLEPNTPLHHCALVPTKNSRTGKTEANLWIEYRGFAQLAYQSGMVEDIYAETVCENDYFEFDLGTEKVIHHRYDIRKPRGKSIAYYAVVKFKNGGKDFKVLTVHDCEKIRDASPGKGVGPWASHFDAMGEKSAIRRVLKTAPMALDKDALLAKAIDHDSRVERGDKAAYEDIIEVIGEVVNEETGEVTETPKTKVDAMKDRLNDKAGS